MDNMLIGIISAFFASLLFSIIFNIAKKNLLYCGLIGAIGWSAYLIMIRLGSDTILATFVGSLSITAVAYLLAILQKTPATVFLVPGIVPLVPGSSLYQSIYYYTQRDYDLFQQYAFEALSAAIAIAIAVITISAIYRFIRNLINHRIL
jgi:uncharacterized membrane protein YjjB (DUF3815 family)